MEKTFVNALAYSRIAKLLIILVLTIVVVVDVLAITLVVNAINYASAEQRIRIIGLLTLLLLSSASGFPILYLMHRSLRDQWIRTDDRGITYNSWAKKISATWDEVTGVSVVSRGRYGQALRNRALCIDTKKGRFYAPSTFVDKSMPIPQLKLGVSSQRFSYPDGRTKEVNIRNSDIYMELRNYIPELLNSSLERQA
jgi:hypothetical protein